MTDVLRDELAFPIYKVLDSGVKGLTKRELFAAMAMQGIANAHLESPVNEVAATAVQLADALLAILEK